MYVKTLVDEHEWSHLQQFAREGPYNCRRQPRFDEELRKLRKLGFIENKHHDRGVSSMPRNAKFDVKDYFRITDGGKEYIELRQRLGLKPSA